MMKKYIIKTRIRNIRYEMIDYEYSYSVGELEPLIRDLLSLEVVICLKRIMTTI